ncbi:unnamed protein product [Brassica oleracea var. botrytis]
MKLTAMNKLLMEENDIGCRSKCHTWFMKRATSVNTLPT